MINGEVRRKYLDNPFSFEPDEIYMDRKLEGMTPEELLSLDTGLYKVSEVERVLGLQPGTLRSLALKLTEAGESPYEKWGIGNSPISHWIVRIKVFGKRWESEIKPQIKLLNLNVKHLPEKISPDELCELDGVVKLSDLKGKFPFHQQSIKNQVRKIGEKSREEMGCWKEKSHFYVDIQPFLRWISKFKYK